MQNIAFLNGEYLPLEQARISPLDRGFLFGEGVYEVIPAIQGRAIALVPHIHRLLQGMRALEIKPAWALDDWRNLCEALIEKNTDASTGSNLGIYLHVSRGADKRRFHAYPEGLQPTIFGFAFELQESCLHSPDIKKTLSVITAEDLRWQRCHIKSTSLLGNVMHFQQGQAAGSDEAILHNANGNVTEASAANVFLVKDGTVITPPLEQQLLPGITRMMLLDILSRHTEIPVEERPVTLQELRKADEVWLTSSTKGVTPVTRIDGEPVANGEAGELWQRLNPVFHRHKFDY